MQIYFTSYVKSRFCFLLLVCCAGQILGVVPLDFVCFFSFFNLDHGGPSPPNMRQIFLQMQGIQGNACIPPPANRRKHIPYTYSAARKVQAGKQSHNSQILLCVLLQQAKNQNGTPFHARTIHYDRVWEQQHQQQPMPTMPTRGSRDTIGCGSEVGEDWPYTLVPLVHG